MKQAIGIILILGFLSGCNSTLRSNADVSGVNAVPFTFEKPDADQSPQAMEPEKTEMASSTPSPTVARPVSRLIYFAQKILETEGKKLGTACNLYVHRVLQVAGFHYEVFMANDFDVYAKRYFKSYKVEDFNRDTSNAEENRLKKHLWSYPERTPFIMQWSRAGVHGHIAFVERIGEKLVIYQSSLGTKTPRKDQTTVDILLNGYNRRQLSVYSEMTAK